MKDFIQNRDGDFITRNNKSISWNKGTTSFVLRGKTIGSKEEALSIIYKQMRHRAVSLGYPQVKISFNPQGSYTDLKDIWVGLDFLGNPDFTYEQKVDIAKGLTTHELSHIMFTCWTTKRSWVNDLSESDAELADAKIFGEIANILEDERIEANVVKKFGGVADDLALVKRNYFGKLVKFNPQSAIQDSLVLLLYAVRYPSSIPQELIDAYPEFYAFITERLSELYNNKRLTAKKDYAHILQASLDILKKLPIQRDGQDEQGNGASGSTFEDAVNQVRDEQNAQREEYNKTDAEFDDIVKEYNKAMSDKSSKEVIDEIKKRAEEKADERDEKRRDYRDARDKVRSLLNNSGIGDLTNPEDEEQILNDFQELREQVDFDTITERGKFTKQISRVTEPRWASKNRAHWYDTHKEAIRPLIPTLRKAMALQFECKDARINNLKSGKIKNLVGAYSGRQDVFSKQPDIVQDKLNLAILVDSSGSMDGVKMQIARDFAMLFYQTFYNSPNVNLWVFGIRDEDTEAYYSPTCKGKFKENFSGLAASGGNNDGHQIMTSADIIRKHNNEPCVMVCISDGEPSDSEYLKYSVNAVKSRNFYPIQIGIGTEYAKRGNSFFKEWAEVSYDEILDVEYGRGDRQAIRENTTRKFAQVVRTKIASVLA